MTTLQSRPRQAPAAADQYTKLVVITPAQAQEWLNSSNTHNRDVRKSVVVRFAREMTEGRWRITHQGIAFDHNGVLLDGQHRLAAIVLADVSVRMNVTYNMDKDSQLVVDQHKARSAADAITLAGGLGRVDSNMMAVLRCMLRGMRRITAKMSITEEEIALRKHWDAVQFTQQNLNFKIRGVANAATRAVIARAYYSVDHAKLKRFCQVLTDGMATSHDEAVILMLWKYLIQSGTALGGRGQMDRYMKTSRALHAYVNGEQLAKLYAAAGELFPLPEEANEDGLIEGK